MDRLVWVPSSLCSNEKVIDSVNDINLYDGDKRTDYKHGCLTLTNMRLLWRHTSNTQSLSLNISSIIFMEEEPKRFTSSPKIILHLYPVPAKNLSQPALTSHSTFIKLSFSCGDISSFRNKIEDVISQKPNGNEIPPKEDIGGVKKSIRTGILGIERDIQEKNKETDTNINKAFEDLKNLMGYAKEMVNLSKSIATKIKDQTGEISSDETVLFRSYLLSLGLDDPVTKDAIGSTSEYHKKLAHELCNVLVDTVKDIGGVMILSEVYCRINRARGLQLVSPDDILNACSLMSTLKLPLKLHSFESGIKVLQLSDLDESKIISLLKECLDLHKSEGISAIEFSHLSGTPLLLAQERLKYAETIAVAVRDESSEGLRFYPNLFLSLS